jgi:hypothetical protein
LSAIPIRVEVIAKPRVGVGVIGKPLEPGKDPVLDFKFHPVRRGAAGIDIQRLGRIVTNPIGDNSIVKHIAETAQTELDVLEELIIDSQILSQTRFR